MMIENNITRPCCSQKRANFLVWTILILYPMVGMGIDLIAPALPDISRSLHISSMLTKNLISMYLFGYAVGNLLIGFLSDAWGRRRNSLIYFFIPINILLMNKERRIIYHEYNKQRR